MNLLINGLIEIGLIVLIIGIILAFAYWATNGN